MYFAELCTRFTQLFYDLLIEIIESHAVNLYRFIISILLFDLQQNYP